MSQRWTRLGSLLAGAALAAVAFSGTAPAAEYEFKLHHFLGPKAPAHRDMLEPWAKRIEEASGGRVAIELYPSMSLGGKPPELIRQVRDGVVDIVWTVNGYTPGLFPRTEVFELPFVHTNDTVATNLAMADMFEQSLAEEYEGLKVLFLHVHAGQAIQMVDTPIRKVEDMAGKKIRIPTRTGAWVLEALGANPVGMPVPELPQALSKKVVDGALIPWEIIPALKLQDLTDYDIEGPDKARLGTTTFQVSMNLDKWNSLPPDIQKIFEEQSGRDWLVEVGQMWRNNDDRAIAMAVEAGNEHIVLSPQAWDGFQAKLEPVVTRWEQEVGDKGIDGKALVQRARHLIQKNAATN